MKVKQRLYLFIVALSVTGAACRPVSAQSPPPVQQILRQMFRAELEVPLEGVLVTKDKKGRELRQKISKKPPCFLRMEVLSPAPRRGEVLVRNGEMQWHFRPRPEKTVVQQPIAPGDNMTSRKLAPQIERLRKNFTPEYVGTEKVAGRETAVIAIKPNNPSLPTRKIWVDTERFIALKHEQRAPDGTLIQSVEFETINFNPEFDNATFEFTLPPDAKVVRAEWDVVPNMKALQNNAPFTPGVPIYRPKGFQLKNAAIRKVKTAEPPEIWLRFSDGLNDFSLFQKRLPHNAPSLPVRPRPLQGPRGGLVWAKDGYLFTIVGELPEPELRRIAQSVRVQKLPADADSR
jgi:outer membrane lipoprotein-sorting protein